MEHVPFATAVTVNWVCTPTVVCNGPTFETEQTAGVVESAVEI